MQPLSHHPNPDIYDQLPKVELHRHLEGSVRLETLRDVAREHGVNLPSIDDLPSLVQVQVGDDFTFSNFLSKFQTLRGFYLSKDIITRVAYEAVADAAAEGVIYLELRFAPVALSRVQGFAYADVMDWVINSVEAASKQFDITTRLLLTVNRHETPQIAEEVARLGIERMPCGVVGLDLAGNEAEFPAEPFKAIFQEAHRAGLALSIHAGEWNGPDNVRHAIEKMDADRIGHGVRVLEDPAVVALARQRQTTFEVCVTSNYQSGVITSLADHPVRRMIDAGLNVTLNTDDPSISRITLSDEYRLVCETLGLPFTTLTERILAAARASFLPAGERERLVQKLQARLAHL